MSFGITGGAVPPPIKANGSPPELSPPNAGCPVTGALGLAVPTPINPVVGRGVVLIGVEATDKDVSVKPVAGS
jgi:hypothetical protein